MCTKKSEFSCVGWNCWMCVCAYRQAGCDDCMVKLNGAEIGTLSRDKINKSRTETTV